MSDPASSSPTNVAPLRKRRPKPTAPPALQTQVNRVAKVMRRHETVLGPIGIDALRVATLQVVATKLGELQALLAANGFPPGSVGHTAGVGQPIPPAPAGPRCALCGRAGVYQSRTARVERGQERPWYCRAHASTAVQEDRASVPVPVAPSPEPGAPNIAAAMAALGE